MLRGYLIHLPIAARQNVPTLARLKKNDAVLLHPKAQFDLIFQYYNPQSSHTKYSSSYAKVALQKPLRSARFPAQHR
jgi:hypothetical protein